MANANLQRLRNAHPPYRARVYPHGTILGRVGPNNPSPAHPSFGAQGEMPGGQPTYWTPWGLRVAEKLPLMRLGKLGPPGGMVTRSPGAYFTPPATFQLCGIPVEFSLFAARRGLTSRPAAGRTSTPPIRHYAINPFPSARLPLPTNPPPSAFRGVIY